MKHTGTFHRLCHQAPRLRTGHFPLWLAPDQVRVDADFSAQHRQRSTEHCSALRLVIGGRDLEAGAVSVRLHHGGPSGTKPKGEVLAGILARIKQRRA